MKTRLKHLSKSTISIILVLLMVISTVTVGIVATSAAYVDPSGKVGATTPTIYFYNGSGSQTYSLGSEFTLNIPSNGYNGNDAWLYIKDDNGTQYGGGSVSVGNQYNVPFGTGEFKLTNAKNYTNIKLKITKNNDTITVKWVSGSSSSSNFYIVGDSYLGLNWTENNFVQMTNTSTNVYSWTSGDLTASSTARNFRVTDQNNWDGNNYGWSNHTAVNNDYIKTEAGTSNNNIKITIKQNCKITVTYNSSSKTLTVTATPNSKTVTYGICSGQSSMGSITAKIGNTAIGDSPASVASGSSVVFTATPNFGYEFVGWFNTSEASGGTQHSASNSYTRTINDNVTVYARFAAATPDPYYLGGRFAVATSSANIHSSTIGKNGVEQYGQVLNDGAGLAKSTNSTSGTINYRSYNENSTNLKFKFTQLGSDAEGSRHYTLNTYRTVKQLSEDKDDLVADYGGSNSDYHDPFYFVIHDKAHKFGIGSSAGHNFQNNNSESNALAIEEISAVAAQPQEIRFNNYASQSNGWVRIHLLEDGYMPSTGTGGTLKIWYEIVDETPPAAGTVRISATPSRIDRNSSAATNVTVKGSYVADSLNAAADTITYTFYKSTDGKNWTPLRAADTSDTYSYKETANVDTMYYKVVVGSNATTGGRDYDTRSASTSVEVYASGLYMSGHISGNNNPSWGSDRSAYLNYNYPYKRTTSSSYKNSNPYIFSLSTMTNWDPELSPYTIDEASNQFCTITTQIKEVTVNEQPATVVTYVVTPNPKCSNPRIYVDFKNKKIWAIADYSPSTPGNTNNYGSEKVTYYFAEADYCLNKSNPTSGTGMRIHYWNNSNTNLNGNADVTTEVKVPGKNSSNVSQNNNHIYVSRKDLFGTGNQDANRQSFYVYSVELPIWATSFQFVDSNTNAFEAQPTYTDSVTNSKDHSITLNPNRIYVLYEYGGKYYVKGVVLDETMWTYNRTLEGNQVKTFKVDTNVIKYTDLSRLHTPYKPNGALSQAYQAYDTPWALYFGYLENSNSTVNTGQSNITQDYNSWGTTLFHLYKDNKQHWAANLAQRNDDHAYYASVQNLVGMTTSKTKFNPNGDGETFGYLMDTKGNNELTSNSTLGKSTANNHPLFAYQGDGTRGAIDSYSAGSGNDNHTAASSVRTGKKFPFYESTLNGITTYSYDSTTDRNRKYYGGNFTIQSANESNGFTTGTDSDGNQYVGLFPFGGNTNSKDGCAFGLEFDLTFYMTNTGYLTDTNSNDQDIAFNFSGDDDVWVFVDGIKVLDLGGDHKVSAATINFTDGKVYYKSSAASIDSSAVSNGGVRGTWAYANNNYINVVDLKELMAAYGKPFNPTDATTKHTFQMFYMERGAFQSNCVVSFNLPQATGLNVKNNVEVSNVNRALKKDTLYATNPDYFTYNVNARLVSNDLPSSISSIAKDPATSTGTLDFSKPVYPYGYETKRVYDDGVNPIQTYILSTAGTHGSGGLTLSYDTSSWTPVKDTVYELSDEYIKATTTGKAHVTGKTDNTSSADFHLLGGQMAIFNDKITQNSYVKVTQTQGLGTVNNTSPIQYQTVANNNTASYYITSYSVYDEKSKKYIVPKTSVGIGNSDHNAADTTLNDTTGEGGFYFSNYTGDAEDANTAMRVDFYNEVAVGTIRIKKELDDQSTSNAKFNFRLKLSRLFGSGKETLKEYPGLEYTLYYSDGTPIGTRWYDSRTGITIAPGQYAEIEGVPVETYYEVEEIPAAGYSFTKLTKTAEKPNGDTIYYRNNAATANEYSQTILAPAAPKTTNAAITTEDDFVIYKNMIPPVEETVVAGTSNYISLNKLEFINQREQFTITFKYYDRDTTSNIPASISDVVTQYSVTLKNLDDYIYKKGDTVDSHYSYLEELPGINDLADGEFVAYNYEKMIADKAVDFAEDTNVSNLIDDYHMWTRQDKAVEGMKNTVNLKTGNKYSAAEAVYHTTRNGQPNDSGEKWVNYCSESSTYDPENPADESAAFHAGDLSSFENIKSIVVWLYNTPKEYTVNIYGAKTTNDLGTPTNITLKGSNKTIQNARIAKLTSSNSYENVKGYYSQRLADPKGDEYLDTIAYLDVYDIPACVKQDGEYVCPETKASPSISGLQFAYWAYDPDGTQVASTDYKYGYRITGNFDLYAVYAPGGLTNYGLTIVKDADDNYIDNAGNARIRINTMFTPYGLPDYDPNIKRAAVVNIYVSKLLREDPVYYNESKIKELMDQYSSQLLSMLAANTFTSLHYETGTPTALNVELTTKGYVKLVNSGSGSIDLTNKNRVEFTTQFAKSQLYTDNGIVGILQIGAMAYDKNNDNAVSADEWILSDNSILRTYSKS
ncbi:MAG: hypothetical protein UIH27_07265 [Ruminococcus sp.]|nr:hypothetical protein [Ruminococcus sp.]